MMAHDAQGPNKIRGAVSEEQRGDDHQGVWNRAKPGCGRVGK